MAYEAALDAGVDEHHLNLFEVFAMKSDTAWYNEFADIGWWKQNTMEEKVTTDALRFFERDLDHLGVEPFVTAPIVSDQKWDVFVKKIPSLPSGFTGQNIIGPLAREQDVDNGNFSRL